MAAWIRFAYDWVTKPSIGTLTDNFATKDTAKWAYSTNATVTSGQLILPPQTLSSVQEKVTSNPAGELYSLIDSSISVELIQTLNTHATAGPSVQLIWYTADFAKYISLFWFGYLPATLYARVYNGCLLYTSPSPRDS